VGNYAEPVPDATQPDPAASPGPAGDQVSAVARIPADDQALATRRTPVQDASGHHVVGHGHAHTAHPGPTPEDLAAEPQASAVRVRFCPSPTGTPHVGLIRTALFNWAHARHVGGAFVFRVEDTDPARDSEESYRQLLEALSWLGLGWDEGVEVGGPHAPYRQSERLPIYADVARRLLEAGYAYESFVTPEELEERHRAAGRDPKSGYDGCDRHLTAEERAAYRARGREPVLRVRMPDEDVTFSDLVRGDLTFAAGSVPDFVIVRANGQPLYTLTNPVDDALMGITHVLRGEDLLSSTPRQVVLFRALLAIGVATVEPVYGHLPYVMGEGNRKLSKRDPESSIFRLRDRGFVREGLLNYLALLGWGIGPDRDVFTVEELVAAFDAHDVNPNPARFDLAKAEAINAAHVRLLEPADLAARIVPYLHGAGLVAGAALEDLPDRDRRLVLGATPLVQPRLTLLGEAPEKLAFLFVEDDALTVEPDALAALRPEVDTVLDEATSALEALPEDGFTTAAVEEALRSAVVEGLGIRPRLAFGPIRTAISGSRVSPPLFESIELLGRSSALARLRALRTRA
jgi:glutamyl-tRNA synthetase